MYLMNSARRWVIRSKNKKVRTVLDEAQQVHERNSKNHNREEGPSKYDGVEIDWTSESRNKHEVHGLENDKLALNKIFERHENDNDNRLKVVGIVGTRGVGKTTLCREYFNLLGKPDENGEKLFVPRIWVSMSFIQKITVVEKMLKSLGVDTDIIVPNDPKRYLEGLFYLLRLQLIGRRYLIVLDDLTLFSAEAAREIASELPKGYKGTIMVTSREEKFVKEMGGGDDRNVHRFLPLSDPQSLWLIFKDAVKYGVQDEGGKGEFDWEDEIEKELKRTCYDEIILSGKNIDVKKLIEEMLISKCNGIPLAAKLIAKTMSQKIRKFHDENKMQLPEKADQMGIKGKEFDDSREGQDLKTIDDNKVVDTQVAKQS